MCTVFPTVVLVMLCMKIYTIKNKKKKLRNLITLQEKKNTFVFVFLKRNSQLHSQPSIALLLVIKTCSRHVVSERRLTEYLFFPCLVFLNPNSEISSPVQTMQKTEAKVFSFFLFCFLKIQYKQLPPEAVFSIQCTKRAVFLRVKY